jgi:hypothetical protein
MAPATGTALIILVAFLLPGFVTVLFQERTFKLAEDLTPLDRLLRVLYYSLWIYLLLALVALVFGEDRHTIEALYDENKGDPAELIWRGALLLLVASAVVATATRAWDGSKAQKRVREIARINQRHGEPTAWDFFYRQRVEAYVRVTFKGGGRVYGFYGEHSFAAYAKDGRDLFLERAYGEKDDWFGDEPERTAGIWINVEDAVCVEFYSRPDATATQTQSSEDAESAETAKTADGDAEARGTRAAQATDHSPAVVSATSASKKEGLKSWVRSKLHRRAT